MAKIEPLKITGLCAEVRTAKDMLPKVLIGIDPGADTCSVALYLTNTRTFIDFYTGKPQEVKDYLYRTIINNSAPEWRAVVEDPNLDSLVYGAWEEMQRAITMNRMGKMNEQQIKSVFSRKMKHAQDVGKNKQIATEFLFWFQCMQIPTISIKPSSRKRARWKTLNAHNEPINHRLKGIDLHQATMPTKTDPKQFEVITKHTGKTNEHQRDAGTLIANRTFKWHELQQALSSKVS